MLKSSWDFFIGTIAIKKLNRHPCSFIDYHPMFKAQISNSSPSQIIAEERQLVKRQPQPPGFKQVRDLAKALLDNPYSLKSLPCGYVPFTSNRVGPLNLLSEGEKPAEGLNVVTIQLATEKTMHVAATRLPTRSSGSTMRRVLSPQNKNPSQREKTALLQTQQYQSGMTLPADYEIVSHASTDAQEFKVVGKRMEGDSSRFYAKNVSTGETLCTLKRTPTKGGFVWMHPEDIGLGGGMETTSSAVAETKLTQDQIERSLDDLRLVGESKLLGYLPMNTLKQCVPDPEIFQKQLQDKGIKAIFMQLDKKFNSLFAYDSARLQRYLDQPKNKAILEERNWPTEVDQFVVRVSFESSGPGELFDLIALAFNDPRPKYHNTLDIMRI